MTTDNILKKLEEVAPVKLSDEFCKKFNMYDNSGLIINCGGEIKGALFALDLTLNAVKKAKSLGFNLIVTHHPAIYGGVSRLDLTRDPQAKALAECIKNGISVISMHLNFDAAPQGIDYFLMRGLGGNTAEIAAEIPGGGYGRVYEVEKTNFAEYVQKVKKEFGADKLIAYGDKQKTVNRVASFCGAGCDDHNMNFAREHGADVFVSADMKHHEILALTQKGIAVILLTHYASENYGFNKIYLKIKDGLNVNSEYFTDTELL
ncbi:MAG: Nif3-like dinuclear metal center hexameric protein [Clostridia bacterium]|nr:Nif3-like dinuclear metal center hexameric protein [Clostridia bacterium]